MVAMAEETVQPVASVYGSYIDELLCMVKANGDRFFYSTNDLYSVYALTDSNGTVVERYMYDPYGKVTVLDGNGTPRTGNQSAYGNPFTWQSRRLDSETGLMYFRQRMYSPELGRFVSRYYKPWLDLNWYQFQFSLPSVLVDPMGDPKGGKVRKAVKWLVELVTETKRGKTRHARSKKVAPLGEESALEEIEHGGDVLVPQSEARRYKKPGDRLDGPHDRDKKGHPKTKDDVEYDDSTEGRWHVNPKQGGHIMWGLLAVLLPSYAAASESDAGEVGGFVTKSPKTEGAIIDTGSYVPVVGAAFEYIGNAREKAEEFNRQAKEGLERGCKPCACPHWKSNGCPSWYPWVNCAVIERMCLRWAKENNCVWNGE